MVSTPAADVAEATGRAPAGGMVKVAADVWRERLRGRGEGWGRVAEAWSIGGGWCGPAMGMRAWRYAKHPKGTLRAVIREVVETTAVGARPTCATRARFASAGDCSWRLGCGGVGEALQPQVVVLCVPVEGLILRCACAEPCVVP